MHIVIMNVQSFIEEQTLTHSDWTKVTNVGVGLQ